MTEHILAVQRMQDYIEAHLEEKIAMTDLAREAAFSPWYSHRLFQDYTGLTPASYIRRLRLAKAALRLKHESGRIIDAAFTQASAASTCLPVLFPGNSECVPAVMPQILSLSHYLSLTAQNSGH